MRHRGIVMEAFEIAALSTVESERPEYGTSNL